MTAEDFKFLDPVIKAFEADSFDFHLIQTSHVKLVLDESILRNLLFCFHDSNVIVFNDILFVQIASNESDNKTEKNNFSIIFKNHIFKFKMNVLKLSICFLHLDSSVWCINLAF